MLRTILIQLTSILSNIAVKSAEDNIDLVLELLGCAALDNQIAQLFAHGQALLPLDGIAVLLASAPRASSNGGESKVRVKGEEEDEALAYATSGSEDTFEEFLSANCHPNGASMYCLNCAFSKGMLSDDRRGLTNRTASWESPGPGK